jgi:hypothetical protein
MLLFDAVVRLFLTLSSSGQVSRSNVNNTINDLRSCLTSPFEAIVRETGAVRRSDIVLTRALLTSEPVDTPEALAAKAEVMAAHAAITKQYRTELPAEVLQNLRVPTHRRKASAKTDDAPANANGNAMKVDA